MAFRIINNKAVRFDIREIKSWYKRELPGLEKRFAADMRIVLFKLVENPYVHTIRYDNIRIAHTANFPYSIHFKIDDTNQRIIILGVVHNSRDSIIIKNRL